TNESTTVRYTNGVVHEPAPKRLFKNVLAITSRNKSSMLQDIEAGRKTEISQLNGSITRLGSLVGVSTPFNYLLTKLVLSLEGSQSNFSLGRVEINPRSADMISAVQHSR